VKKYCGGRVRVYPNDFQVSDSVFERISEEVKRRGATIFNQSDSENDGKRSQLRGRLDHAPVAAVVERLRLHEEMQDRAPVGCSVLHSKAGCEQQLFHTDYDAADAASCNSAGVLAALEDGTRFVFKERAGSEPETVPLQRGDILIFDFDVIHAGAGYDAENTRVHIYLDGDGSNRERNVVWDETVR